MNFELYFTLMTFILGQEEKEEEIQEAPFTASQLPLIPIIGSLLAVLVLLIILIDISCYKINEIGIILHQ